MSDNDLQLYCFKIQDQELNNAEIYAYSEFEMKEIYFEIYFCKRGYTEEFEVISVEAV